MGRLHCLKGEWTKARSLIEHGIAVLRTGNIVITLPAAVAQSAWVLAQVGEASEALTRVREGEELLDRQAARGVINQLGRGLPLAGSCWAAARPARQGAEPR